MVVSGAACEMYRLGWLGVHWVGGLQVMFLSWDCLWISQVRGTSHMFVTGPDVLKQVTHEDVTQVFIYILNFLGVLVVQGPKFSFCASRAQNCSNHYVEIVHASIGLVVSGALLNFRDEHACRKL